MINNNNQNNLMDISLDTSELSEKEKQLYDFFLDELKIDYNPVNACRRIGINESLVYKCAKNFMNNKYVLKELAKDPILSLPDDPNSQEKAFKFIASTLFNIANTSCNKDKLEACKQLSSMYGLNKVEINTKSNITNVIEIPQAVSDAEWEEQAMEVTESNMRE